MKKFARKSAGRRFLKPFFLHSRKRFSEFRSKFLSLLYIISLAYKISHCLSANHNPKLRCVICTGVTLFAQVLHLNCTALSQSESSNFFMCIIILLNIMYIFSNIITVIRNIGKGSLIMTMKQFANKDKSRYTICCMH